MWAKVHCYGYKFDVSAEGETKEQYFEHLRTLINASEIFIQTQGRKTPCKFR
jgi:hypothetical protein